MNVNPYYTRLGANFNEETRLVDFSLYSKHGEAAFLCIFDAPIGKDACCTLKMEKSGDIFGASFDPKKLFEEPFEGKVFYYGYRVFGPNFKYDKNWTTGSDIGFKTKIDDKHNCFNPNKLAYDPYARELSHLQKDVSEDLGIFRSGSPLYFIDNGKLAPKSVFRFYTEEEKQNSSTQPPCRALKDEIIGEVHLKSLTELQNFPEHGTYEGASKFAEKLKSLGVTMVEFLPLQEFDANEGCGNYWGYMPLAYFAPVKRYAYDKREGLAAVEFKRMTEAFHGAGLKVCLDVVYNHTGEARNYNGNPDDLNLFSYALIDNRDYYKTDAVGRYASNSGCGNDVNSAREGFKHLIADSLEFWINLGVDAFRFDLAAALLDTGKDFEVHYDKSKSFIGELKNILEGRGIKVLNPDEAGMGVNLIAEPWTCGGRDNYQLGNFPECFAEWNDTFRNTVRATNCRPYAVDFLAVKHALRGTLQKFSNPFKSVNYVACHDGFTLFDLNSYDKKAATTCGGSDWEISSSFNGDKALRNRAIRNSMALLVLSSGCLMVQVDDLILHSKGGNNNSYNLDSSVNYLDFDNIPDEKLPLINFIKNLIDLRKDEKIFKSPEFVKNMKFYGLFGEEIKDDDAFWFNPACEFLGLSSFMKAENSIRAIFIAINKGDHEIEFKLPEISDINPEIHTGASFNLIFDTKTDEFSKEGVKYSKTVYNMAPHTVLAMFVY